MLTVSKYKDHSQDYIIMSSLQDAPLIILQPQSVHAKQGETVHMTCQADAHPPPKYTWHRLGDTEVYSFTSLLIITATNTSEGSYYCLARTSSSTSARSNLGQLLILRRPVIGSKQVRSSLVWCVCISVCLADSVRRPVHHGEDPLCQQAHGRGD